MQQSSPGQGQSGDSLIGKTIGGYRIVRYIARGGMGVVYEGLQISLDRPVAIKILYPHLADDPAFVERFQREARSEARLNHPHIVRVLDFGSDNGSYYMVMEYIDGESLRDRLARVSAEGLTINPNDMLRIVEEVGSALSFAHSLGLVHRDVKPGNILLGKDGHAYLADFGVVKILGEASMTVVGTIVGTPEYMAPEQGSGAADIGPAADLYSLAIITYEMMVGRAPFKAPTPAAVLQMQLTQPPPPPSTLAPWFLPEVEDVLMRALAKNPADRQASVDEFVQQLRIATAGIRERATGQYSAPGTLTGAALVGTQTPVGGTQLPTSDAGAPPTQPQQPAAPPAMTDAPATQPQAAATTPPLAAPTPTLQPAAETIPPPPPSAVLPAFQPAAANQAAETNPPPPPSAVLPAFQPADATPAAPSVSAAASPAQAVPVQAGDGQDGDAPPPVAAGGFGPDARRNSRRELVLVAVVGVLVIALAAYIFTRDDEGGGVGSSATPTPDRAIAATPTPVTATSVPEATPSLPTATVAGPASEPTATPPPAVSTPTEIVPQETPTSPADEPTATEALVPPSPTAPGAAPPGYQAVIVFAAHRGEVHDSQIYIMNADGSDQRQLTFSRGHSWGPRVSPDGERLIFSSVAPGEHSDHSATGGGTSGQGNHDIYLANVDGSNITKLTFVPSWDNGWSWSPDGRWITFTSDRDGNWEIYRMDPDGANVARITFHEGNDGWPSWTPDGSQIVFSSDRTGDWEIYSMNADGSGVRQLTNRPGTVDTYPFVSPDGTRIVFSSQIAAANEGEIYVMDIDGGNVTRLTSTAALNYAPSWAPDGSKIVFVSDRDGNHNIYSMNPDGTQQQRLTTDPGEDTTPSWAWIRVGP